MYERFGRVLDRCESHIERRLAIAFLFSEQYTFRPVEEGPVVARDALDVALAQQIQAEGYRIDFALWHGSDGQRVAVECDGHAFHDGDREAAERDKARDRRLIVAGWQVLRFTGRELVRDPLRCAHQAWRVAGARAPAVHSTAAVGGFGVDDALSQASFG